MLLIPVCCTHRLKYSGSAAVLVARWGRSQAGALVAEDRPKKKPSVSLAVVEEEEEEEEADKEEEEEEPQPEQTSGTKNKRARSETPTACSRKRTLGTQRVSRGRPQPVQVVVEQTHSINSLRGGPLLHCDWEADCGCQARTSSATTALLLGCLVSDPQATAGSHGKGHTCALRR